MVHGKFLPFTSFQDRFKIKCNFLSYLQVISAIPKRLQHRTRSPKAGPKTLRPAYETTFPLTPSLNIDLYKKKFKDYYWLYLNGTLGTTCKYCNRTQKMGKRTESREYWLHGRHNLITLENNVMKTDYENSIFNYSID